MLLTPQVARADLSDDLDTSESKPLPEKKGDPDSVKKSGSTGTATTSNTSGSVATGVHSDGARTDTSSKKSGTPAVKGTSKPVGDDVEPQEDTGTGSKEKKDNKAIRASEKKEADRKNLPVHWSSEGNSIYTNDGVLKIPDALVITQGDLKLESNSGEVYFLKQKKQAAGGGSESIDKVELKGNVRVTRFSNVEAERMSAKADRAVFENSNRKVVLIGNARVFKGGSLVHGKQITYDLATGTISIDKAEGVVRPEDAPNKKTPQN